MSRSLRIPGYKDNAVLQLVVATGVGFILYNFTWVAMCVFGKTSPEAHALVIPAVALAPVHDFIHRPWTLLTYGWTHLGFFEWLSTAVWLYTFGSVVQQLVGYRQVIPTFFYGLLAGGVACLLAQLIPAAAMVPTRPIMTAQAGVMALMGAALTLAPRYRFYLGERLAIPIWIVVAIYLMLNVAAIDAGNPPMLFLALGGAAAGSLTMLLIRRGYRPGAWMYSFSGTVNSWGTPDEDKLRRANSTRRQMVNSRPGTLSRQQRIDAILDKINQRGYGALTKEERELLQQESKGG